MNYRHDLIFYQAVTPLHVGCGQDVGVVDLPVFRERSTGYPLLPGSGTRGALRALFEREDPAAARWLFGPRLGLGEEPSAGCVAVHDAKLLLFPVRSDHQVFLWLTCPAALERLEREQEVFAPKVGLPQFAWKGTLGEDEFLGPAAFGDDPNSAGIHLEEFRYLPVTAGDEAEAGRDQLAAWAASLGKILGRPKLGESVVLVSDRSFFHFASYATVIQQRVALSAAKTVQEGQLFSLEALPPESVFFGFLGGTWPRQALPLDPNEHGEEVPAGPDAEPETPGEASSEPAADPMKAVPAPLTRRQVLERLRHGLTNGAASTYLHLGGDESIGLGVTKLQWALPETTGGHDES